MYLMAFGRMRGGFEAYTILRVLEQLRVGKIFLVEESRRSLFKNR